MIGGGRGGGGARQHNLGDSKAQFSSSGAKGVQGAATPSWSPGWAKQSPGHTNTKTTPTFPLSPPLEPLRPFCPPVGPQLLPQLLLQAQYHQLLSRHQQLAAPAPAPLLPRPQAQDSLDLELGASASRVADRQPAHCAPVPEAGGLGGYMVQA